MTERFSAPAGDSLRDLHSPHVECSERRLPQGIGGASGTSLALATRCLWPVATALPHLLAAAQPSAVATCQARDASVRRAADSRRVRAGLRGKINAENDIGPAAAHRWPLGSSDFGDVPARQHSRQPVACLTK